MSTAKLQFDVRNHIRQPQRHNALIQAEYDTVNRMAALLRGITFGEFLSDPFSVVIPRILDNVDAAAESGLLPDPQEVKELFVRLMEGQPEESFRSISAGMTQEDGELSREFWSPVWKLWVNHGVKLPELRRDSGQSHNHRTLAAIDAILREAADFDYPSLHQTPGTKDTAGVRHAVWQGVESFVIYLPHNGLCCTCSGGCQCVFGLSTDYCSLMGDVCSTASSPCGADSPIRG